MAILRGVKEKMTAYDRGWFKNILKSMTYEQYPFVRGVNKINTQYFTTVIFAIIQDFQHCSLHMFAMHFKSLHIVKCTLCHARGNTGRFFMAV